MRTNSRLVPFLASAAFLISFTTLPAIAQNRSSGGSSRGSSGGGSHAGSYSGGSAHSYTSPSSSGHTSSSSSVREHPVRIASAHTSYTRPADSNAAGGSVAFGHGSIAVNEAASSAKLSSANSASKSNSWDPLTFAGVSHNFAPIAIRPENIGNHGRGRIRGRGRDKNRGHNGQPPSNAGFYFLTGGGAYYLPSGDDSAGYDESGAPQADDNGQADSQSADANSTDNTDQANSQPSDQDQSAANAAPAESTPMPDEGQFTLVLHDGTTIQAVAFTHSDGKIIYVTTDGLRLTFADSLLDQDATVRLNLERGTALQLPL